MVTIDRTAVREGMVVLDRDGAYVGEVRSAGEDTFVLHRAWRRDLRVPLAAVELVGADEHPALQYVVLDVAGEAIDRQGWPRVAGPEPERTIGPSEIEEVRCLTARRRQGLISEEDYTERLQEIFGP